MRKALEWLVFIDETSLNTKLVETTGRAPVGERLIDRAPLGRWHTQTFIADLRHDELTAPWVIKRAINRDLFNAYVETQLAATLERESAPAEAEAEIPVCGYWGFSRPAGLGTGVRTGGVPAPPPALAGSALFIMRLW